MFPVVVAGHKRLFCRQSQGAVGGDWGDEAIADTLHGCQVAWSLRRITQRPSQGHDRCAKAALKIDEGSLGPQPLTKLIAGHHFARALQQELQDQIRLPAELDPYTIPEQHLSPGVQHERIEPIKARSPHVFELKLKVILPALYRH